MNELKSRQYFPNTEVGQRDYERQWGGDKQCGPCKVRTDYSKFSEPDEYPKPFKTKKVKRGKNAKGR